MDNYTTTTSTYTTETSSLSPDAALAMMSGLIIFYIIMIAVMYVINAIFLGKIFKKAGVESWIAWVPFYNTWKMLEIGDQKGAYMLFVLVPFVGPIILTVFLYISMYKIGLKLGKSGAFVLLAIFIPIVWLIWLAIDDSKWNGGENNNTIPTPPTYNQQPPQTPQAPQQL